MKFARTLVCILTLSLLGGCGVVRTIQTINQPVLEPASTAASYERLKNADHLAVEEPEKSSGHIGRRGELTEEEEQMARTAWKYFENNYQKETGLINAVNNYPSVTMWDLASYLGALVSAFELQIIDKTEFDNRVRTLWRTLNKVELFRDELPNKAYHTKTGAKVDYTNKPGEIGFSALDLGRFLVWSKIIKERYPEHSNAIDQFVLRWKFCNVVKEGTLYGSYIDKESKGTRYVQEGRLGYEEYASKGFQLWGFDTWKASLQDPYDVIPLYGVDVPYDTRDPRMLSAHNYVVTESYVLDGIEMNWDLATDRVSTNHHHTDLWAARAARAIYQVQENRYKATGILTARTEHQLDKAPYFVYDTIYTDGYPWNTITETGRYVPEFSSIAVKGAVGLWGLWDTSYTDILFRAVQGANNPEKGFFEGIYENGTGMIETYTANNNGILLEVLLHKVQGKLLQFSRRVSLWDRTVENVFATPEISSSCLPSSELECELKGTCEKPLHRRLFPTSQ
ncbi:MAG: DUF3131 domain-containing protein [Pseudomonadota bacterium]